MKHILIFLLSVSFASAAEPVVTVTSATSVTVDGVDSGKPLDTIKNRPELASAIQRALEKWQADFVAAKAADVAAAEAAKAEALAQRDTVAAKIDEAVAATTAAERKAKMDELRALIKGTAKTKRLAEIAAQKAALAEEETKLQTP